MALSSEEIFVKVRQVLVDTMAREEEEEEIAPQARIVADLGVESIDILDIIFRLEKEFGIKIPRSELLVDNLGANEQYVQNGKLTSAGLQELRKRLPYADLTEFSKDPDSQKIPDLFTVGMLCKYIEWKVAEKTA